MISRLYIEDFLLIKDTGIEFGKGLNVISGETGTGKSMTISAIGFVAGNQGNFPEGSAVELQLLRGDEELILRREIKGGKSRYYLNGRGTTKAVVQELLSESITVQGQNDSLKLLREEFQRGILDSFGGLGNILDRVERAYERFTALRRELKSKMQELENMKRQRDYLQFQIQEVEELSLSPKEVEELKQRAEVLKHRERIAKTLSRVINNLYEREDSALSLIGDSLRELLKVIELNTSLREVSETLSNLKESLQELRGILTGMDWDISQEEIDYLNERLYKVQRLEDKYGQSYEQIYSYINSLKDKLSSFDKYEGEIEELKEELDNLERKLYLECEELSQARRKSARRLEREIKDILKELNLERATLRVEFDKTEPTRYGTDRVRFLFSSYGVEPKPLEEVASGGELSRLFLALALLEPSSGAYIFDEIDIGISGEASIKLAKLLKRIAKSMQVIVITHSSSICAAGDKNFLTQKEFIGDIPLVRIKELSYEEKVKEVARLMGTQTDKTIEGAKELISIVS
jgi:DNA repair protein RecN (Recombination protein N)